MRQVSPHYLKGAVFGLAAVSIWAGWSAMTRLAVTTSLDAWDIPALRFGVAGLLLLPIVIRRDLALDRLGWSGLAGLIVGTGAPYALVVALGLRFAPAYDAGALNPGCMPLFVVLIAAIVLGEKPSTTQKIGLSLILSGALIIVGWHGTTWSISRSLGDALFLAASFLTACYTVIMRKSKLDPVHVAALVATGSLVVYAPLYFGVRGLHIAQVPIADLTVQVIFQGIIVTIIALVLYGRAVLILGASGGSAFGEFVPALSAVLAIPLLGEWPTASGWVGIVLISAGVYLASGGPLPVMPRHESSTLPRATRTPGSQNAIFPSFSKEPMTSIHIDLDSIEWTPGSAYKGPDALYRGQEVFYRKVLSDRRQEGGGLAVLSKICPPPGKMVKTVAVARSEEHIFNLRGGRVNKSGKPIEAPGGSYTLNPTGQPHSAMIATENIALVIYSGETDDVKSVEIVDLEAALGEVA